jgi:hypothetical protein
MNNPQMANDQLKKDLKDILKIKGTVTRQRPVKGLIKKETFCRFIDNYKFANDRALLLKNDFQVDFVNYEEPFVQAIEALIQLHFNKTQVQLIEWWLYEKWSQPEEGILELQNNETGEDIPTATPEDLWDLLQTLK